jgi:poly(3-hydroxybutyrate) depolymerase
MAPSPGRGSPRLPTPRLPLSDGTAKDEMPHLVAPTPIYASVSSPVIRYDSNRNEFAPTDAPAEAEVDEREEIQRAPTRPSSSLRALADPDAVLPVQGGEEDVAAAVEKLNRMKKASRSRKLWRRTTGYDAFASTSASNRKEKKQAKWEARDDGE